MGEGDGKSFWAPYVYSNWPESMDAFEHVAAVRAGVALHATPAANAPRVATVDWEILKRMPKKTEDGQAGEWIKVKTANGVEGWVATTDVYSPIGFRAGFSKRSGQWKLEALVAGD